MAKEIYVKLTCDQCKTVHEFPAPQAPGDKAPTEDQVEEVKRWMAVQLGDGRLLSFCRARCLRNFAETYAEPGKLEVVPG